MTENILLVVPVGRSHYIVPPIGLGYLATAVRSAGYDSIRILDCLKEKLSFPSFQERLKALRPKIVGFQIFSADFASVRQSIEMLKQVLPESIVIVGGPHVSATGTCILDDIPQVDFGFVGEGEIGLPLFVRRVLGGENIAWGDIPGLVWRDKSNQRINDRATIKDLDSLGFPAWDLMPPASYPLAPQGAFYKQFPIAPIASSRGCPYTCAFCGSPVNMGNQIRYRSLPHLFDEMELLYYTFGVREFHFVDDMFNASKRRVMEFCRILEEKNWEINYSFPNGLRLNTLDMEMLEALKRTGAYAFTVGIESGSQRILDAMNKKLTVELIRDKVALIDEVGLEPSGFFLLGYPGETLEDMKMTLELAKSLPIKRAHFSNFLPLPGTEATRRLLESGELNQPDWSELCYSKVPYSPKGISPEELKAFQRKAFLSFHLRPRILMKMISEIKSASQLHAILRRARDYLFSS